jgi:hypothetical protein
MPSAGLQAEAVVEGGDVKNFAERNLQAARNSSQSLFREVMESTLDFLQERDEILGALSPTLQHLIDSDDSTHLWLSLPELKRLVPLLHTQGSRGYS